MNYSKQIFKMLGISPNEEFGLKETSSIYKIDENLNLLCMMSKTEWILSEYNMQNILLGTANIVKIIRPTPEDKIAIEYAKIYGCKWLAKMRMAIYMDL